MAKKEEDGVWRTIGGRRVFIKNGQDLKDAIQKSGKFRSYKPVSKNNRKLDDDNEDSSASAGMSSTARKELIKKYKRLRDDVVEEERKRRDEQRMIPLYEKMKQRHDAIISRLSKDDYDSGTYDMETLKPISYNSGFQVTFSQIGDDYDNDTYYKLCKEFLKESSDGKICAGKFEGTPEISFNVGNREKAIELAQKYNQISIWDWANADEIRTGGRGRRL